ncbi:MAG: site-specific integrase [Clostridiales bacterium]|nr:site-specific integrase [Clostridiales bacterium]
MATIIKREGKKGISYKIQVAVKDVGLGKMVTKSTTWKPQKGMTEKEIDTACTVFAEAFEKQVINSYKTAEDEKGNVNITFKALSEKWLARSVKLYGVSYEGNASQGLEKVLPLIGGYKVKDISASIVQSVFDKIDNFRKEVYVIYPKKRIKDILYRQGIDFVWLRKETELNDASLSLIYNGKRVGIKFATMFAEVCKMDLNRLFDVTIINEPYASATLKRFKMVIYNVLAYAVRLCIVDRNYASSEYVDIGKRQQKPVRCMDEQQLQKFYEALIKVDNIQWRVAVLTTLLTGMRRGEVCGLNWEDIDFAQGKLHIQRSYSESPRHGIILKEPKTAKSNRVIAIPELLLQALREYKEWYDERREDWGDRWVESGSVFIQRNGERVHPANLKMWVSKTCDLAGIEHFSVHSLRHTNIAIQIMAHVPIVTVAGRAGHSRTSTTTDVYAYYVQSSDKSAANTLDKIFGSIGAS